MFVMIQIDPSATLALPTTHSLHSSFRSGGDEKFTITHNIYMHRKHQVNDDKVIPSWASACELWIFLFNIWEYVALILTKNAQRHFSPPVTWKCNNPMWLYAAQCLCTDHKITKLASFYFSSVVQMEKFVMSTNFLQFDYCKLHLAA